MPDSAALRVLIAEDEMLIAMVLQDYLELAGYEVVVVSRLTKGMDVVSSQHVDAAILDINLAGQESFPLADELKAHDIPYMFTSGYGKRGLPAKYEDQIVLQKPSSFESIRSALEDLLKHRDPGPI